MTVNIKDASSKYPGALHFRFGDSEELCSALLAIVRSGAKTATCTALRDIENGTIQKPEIGRRDIALEWNGDPALVIETTDLRICRFDEVEEDFALAEGENEDLSGWRRDHQAYFERNGGFSPDMKVLCERFRMVEDFRGSAHRGG